MRKTLLYLTLCLSPLCLGQEIDALGDWEEWNNVTDNQLQSELPLEEYMSIPDQSGVLPSAVDKSEGSPEQSVTFGVGLIGVDEQHLNILDGSSLMDYEDESSDFVGLEGDFFTDEYTLDSFDEDAELSFDQAPSLVD